MNNKIRRIQLGVLVLFSVTVIALAFLLTGMLLNRTKQTLRAYVSNLVAADSRQLQLNIESYLKKVENTISLLFSDDAYYKFDATDASVDQYDKIQAEDKIEDEIVRLGLTENFSDFGVIYSNDECVGMISQGTTALYPDQGLYDAFSSSISRKKTMDGWSFGQKEKYDRLYYTKRLNKHAIALVSFYGRELETVFELPEQLQSMTIRLVDDQNRILYSSDDTEIGQSLDARLADEIRDVNSNATLLNQDELINSNTCSNGWRVVCTMPVRNIMRENDTIQVRMIGMVAAIALTVLVGGFFIYRRTSRSMNGVVNDLSEKAEHDLMTDLLNRQTFEENVTASLLLDAGRSSCVFLMMDLDHFKTINDTLGHAKGDDVIRRTADLMRRSFPDDYRIGRIGGDEFAAFVSFDEIGKEEAERLVHARVDALYAAFAEEFKKEKEQVPVSFCVGVVAVGPGDCTFADLYRRADRCLYISKRNGKGKATYEE